MDIEDATVETLREFVKRGQLAQGEIDGMLEAEVDNARDARDFLNGFIWLLEEGALVIAEPHIHREDREKLWRFVNDAYQASGREEQTWDEWCEAGGRNLEAWKRSADRLGFRFVRVDEVHIDDPQQRIP